MKNTVKIIAILMMIIAVKFATAQELFDKALIITADNEAVKAAQQFNVNVNNADGIVHITWNFPVNNVEGNYVTERSDDGKIFKTISSKHLVNPPVNASNIMAMHYSLEDKTPVDGTSYYRFTKTNKQGDVIQKSEIPVASSVTGITTSEDSN